MPAYLFNTLLFLSFFNLIFCWNTAHLIALTSTKTLLPCIATQAFEVCQNFTSLTLLFTTMDWMSKKRLTPLLSFRFLLRNPHWILLQFKILLFKPVARCEECHMEFFRYVYNSKRKAKTIHCRQNRSILLIWDKTFVGIKYQQDFKSGKTVDMWKVWLNLGKTLIKFAQHQISSPR